MKKYILAAALIVVSTSVIAGRNVRFPISADSGDCYSSREIATDMAYTKAANAANAACYNQGGAFTTKEFSGYVGITHCSGGEFKATVEGVIFECRIRN
jgi:hypothetical protein